MILGKVNTKQQSQSITVPAPTGGLNGRDPLAAMAPTDAYLMDNLFPGTSSVYARKGCLKFSNTSLGAPVQTLEVYTGGDGNKMLAWAGGKIFDVSLAAPSEKASGLLSSTPVTAMFSNAADNAQHMIIVSGVDQPRHYDGTSVATLTMTGMVGSQNTLNYVSAFKGRLYFGQRDMLGFYYLPTGQIQGALSYFDLGQVSRKGGKLVAIGTYSESSTGETPQDYIVFVTDQGECIVYAGYDPSNAATWSLVGRYYTARPIGQRCLIYYGSEMVILTLEGAIAFSSVRSTGAKESGGNPGSNYTAITGKLGAYLSQYGVNADVPGWEGTQYSSEEDGWLILNVPATTSISGQYYQFVMNTVTKAWCRFTNWNGMCFTVFNKQLYFGRYDGYVMLADSGRLDDGDPIRCDAKQAYNYYEDGSGLGMLQKHFQWASLFVACNGQPPLSARFNVDFREEQPEYVNDLAETSGSPWDSTAWDLGVWGFDDQTQKVTITLNRGGFAGALWLRASLQGLTFRWFATQYVMEKTRALL